MKAARLNSKNTNPRRSGRQLTKKNLLYYLIRQPIRQLKKYLFIKYFLSNSYIVRL